MAHSEDFSFIKELDDEQRAAVIAEFYTRFCCGSPAPIAGIYTNFLCEAQR